MYLSFNTNSDSGHNEGTGLDCGQPQPGCEIPVPGTASSVVPGALHMSSSDLEAFSLHAALGGPGYDAPFEPSTKRLKVGDSEDFKHKAFGDQLQSNDAARESVLPVIHDGSTLLARLLSSDVLRPGNGVYLSCETRPKLSSITSQLPSILSGYASHRASTLIGPPLVLEPTLFSSIALGSGSQPSSAGNVFTPTIGRTRPRGHVGSGKLVGALNITTDDANGPVRVVRRTHGWVTVLRNGGRQATGPYRETVHQCVEDQKEVHRLRVERGMANSEVMQLLEQMKHVTDRHPSTLLIKKPKKLDYVAPIGVRRMHKGFRASVRVSGREVYGPLRQEVADATCDRAEMMKYRHVVDAPGMRAFVKTLRDRVYPHHQGTRRQVAEAPSPSSQIHNDGGLMPPLPAGVQQEVERRAREHFTSATAIDVVDMGSECSGAKLALLVVDPSFEGMPTIKRHREVQGVMKDLLDSGELHALSLQTLTPAQWEKKQAQ
ncbi:hypothetical protein FOZ62_032153 [Perkinsus olseni]|uniref:BolA-like protein 3 n=1 Tax=Perkinsus olseni TaxID=32597 RepID=A0A7J6RNS8_PEROL|nr:hypothetical protein FOZ62_032153 [Perkinsus olseni]